jgi:hypothetical protein
MGTSEPAWLHWLNVAGQVAGVILVIELFVVLIVLCALMIGLWYGLRWVRLNVVPIVNQYGEQARGAMAVAVRGGDRIMGGVAEIHGRQQAIKAAVSAFLFGPHTAATPARPLALPPPDGTEPRG